MGNDSLDRLIELQGQLEARIGKMPGGPAEVLEVGAAVLDFAACEEVAFFPVLPLLDPSARADLGDEHDRLAEDLELLRWLVANTPDSPDVSTLANAITHAMRAHIRRDGPSSTDPKIEAGRLSALVFSGLQPSARSSHPPAHRSFIAA